MNQQIEQLLQAFFEMNQMSQQDIMAFRKEFQGMQPQEQQQVIQYIQEQLQGGNQEEMSEQPSQQSPQEEMSEQGMVEQAMQVGGYIGMSLAPTSYRYMPIQYQSGGEYPMIDAGEFSMDNPEMNPQLTMSGTPVSNADVLVGHSEIAKYPIPSKPTITEKDVKRISKDLEKNKAAQRLLAENYDIGKNKKGEPLVDGIVGKKTKAAIEAFAQDRFDGDLNKARKYLGLASENSETVKVPLKTPTATHDEATKAKLDYKEIKNNSKFDPTFKGKVNYVNQSQNTGIELKNFESYIPTNDDLLSVNPQNAYIGKSKFERNDNLIKIGHRVYFHPTKKVFLYRGITGSYSAPSAQAVKEFLQNDTVRKLINI